MKKKNPKKTSKILKKDDVTLFGESVSSTYQWMTFDKQRQIAKKHESLSKKK